MYGFWPQWGLFYSTVSAPNFTFSPSKTLNERKFHFGTRGRAPQPGGKVVPIKEELTTPLRGTHAQLSEFLSSQKTLTHTLTRTQEPHLQMSTAVFPSVSGSSEMKNSARVSSERNSQPGSVCMFEKEAPFVWCLCEWEAVFALTIKAEMQASDLQHTLSRDKY